jgi:hypothetical protein
MTCLSLYSGTVGELVMKCMAHALKTVTLETELIQDIKASATNHQAVRQTAGIELKIQGVALLQSWVSSERTCSKN